MPAAIVPAISAAGSVVSTIGSKNAQKASTAAANQASAGESKLLGAEGTGIQDIMSQYFGSTAPAMNSLMQGLGGQLGQTYSNPYSQAASGTAGQLGNFSTGNTQAAGQTAAGLNNFQGLKPAETAALQTQLGNSGQSTINTLMSQLGGTANPNGLAQSLLNSNNQNALNSTVQLGSMGAQQELGAQEAAGGLYSGLAGQQLQGLGEAGSLQSGLSGQNLSYYGQNLSSLDSLFGQQTGLAQSGLSGLQNMAGLYGQAATSAANNAQSYGNPFASLLSGAGNLSSLFGGGGGASSGPSASSQLLSGINTATI